MDFIHKVLSKAYPSIIYLMGCLQAYLALIRFILLFEIIEKGLIEGQQGKVKKIHFDTNPIFYFICVLTLMLLTLSSSAIIKLYRFPKYNTRTLKKREEAQRACWL